MAVKAPGSKYTRDTRLIIAVVCILGACWLFYDGWISEEFQKKNIDEETGKPNVTLLANRYLPFPLVLFGVGMLGYAFTGYKKKAVLDDDGLTINDGKKIPIAAMTQIDKRDFEKKGFFIITYEEDGASKNLRLSEKTYDNLGPLLDELIAKTGAEPENT